MLFTLIMSKKTVFPVLLLVTLLLFTWFLSSVNKQNGELQEKVKVSLRAVGHELLLSNKDSTSLVLPIVAINNSKYQLSFQNQLSFEPENLVALIKKTFKKAGFSNDYLVEVIQCADNEVAYSYQMKKTVEKSIIPCKGRFLPQSCYIIEVKFTEKTVANFNKKWILYLLIISIVLAFFFFKRRKTETIEDIKEDYSTIGHFKFYPSQNKLVKKAKEISLSRKECELLEIFVANPNTIIKRDELNKKVWENHGVYVNRSLDTYISKLRKKLKDDATIKLINVHGIGYKLETNN